MTDELLTGPVAQAFRDAETRKAERAAALQARALQQAAAAPHRYDPRPAPADEQMYAGTGIGFLFKFEPRSQEPAVVRADGSVVRGSFLPRAFSLGDWELVGR